MAADDFSVRDGEVVIDLPEAYDAGLYYIGRIRTPWKHRRDCPKNGSKSDAVCTVEIDPRWRAGLKDVETCSNVVLLYWIHHARRDLIVQVPSHYGVQRAVFALRSPARPNPIAMSVVKLVGVAEGKLSVVGLDCLDGTPLIDIKPYYASTDSVPEAVVGWRTREA